MPTNEIKKSADAVKGILNNQYGGAGAVIGFVWLIATQKPAEYEQLKDFTSHILVSLNNPIGICIAIYLLLIYFNKSFFKAYLKKETGYATTVKDFESTMRDSFSACLTISESVIIERQQVLERLGNIESGVSRLLSDLSDHGSEASGIYEIVNRTILPKLEKLMEFYEPNP